MKVFLFISIFLVSVHSMASSAYINSGTVETALTNAFTQPDWVSAQSCSLCHTTNGGGPGNVNATFGANFQTVAADVGLGTGGFGLSVANLETIFNSSLWSGFDSDSDASNDQSEFQAGSNPMNAQDTPSNPSTTLPSSDGGDSGGCGMVETGSDVSFTSSRILFAFLLLSFPLLTVLGFRKRN